MSPTTLEKNLIKPGSEFSSGQAAYEELSGTSVVDLLVFKPDPDPDQTSIPDPDPPWDTTLKQGHGHVYYIR
jgi:hypothetical protein